MENITIGEIIGWIAGIMAIAGFVKGIMYLIKHNITDRFERNENQIKINTLDIKQLREDTDVSKEERKLILQCQSAILKTLKNLDIGTIENKNDLERSIEDIERFLNDHAHR